MESQDQLASGYIPLSFYRILNYELWDGREVWNFVTSGMLNNKIIMYNNVYGHFLETNKSAIWTYPHYEPWGKDFLILL